MIAHSASTERWVISASKVASREPSRLRCGQPLLKNVSLEVLDIGPKPKRKETHSNSRPAPLGTSERTEIARCLRVASRRSRSPSGVSPDRSRKSIGDSFLDPPRVSDAQDDDVSLAAGVAGAAERVGDDGFIGMMSRRESSCVDGESSPMATVTIHAPGRTQCLS